MSSSIAVETLRRHNKLLKRELLYLRRLEAQAAEEKDQPGSGCRVSVDEDTIVEAFSRFDVDGNGCIDVRELGLLAASLGEVLNEEELRAAFEAIDASGDGNISLTEFHKWWCSDRQLSTKGRLLSAVLRGKLHVAYAAQGVPALVRQLSEAPTPQEGDWLDHNIHFKVGRELSPGQGAHVAVQVKYQKELDPAYFAAHAATTSSAVVIHFEELPGQTAVQREEGRAAIADGFLAQLSKNMSFTDIVVNTERQGVTTLSISDSTQPMVDPFISLKETGLDFHDVVEDLSMRLALSHTPREMLENPEQCALADMLGVDVSVKVKFRKQLAIALRNLTGQENMLGLNALQRSRIALELGSVRDVMEAHDAPEGVDALAQLRLVYANQLQEMRAMGADEAALQHVHEQQQLVYRQLEATVNDDANWTNLKFYLRDDVAPILRRVFHDSLLALLNNPQPGPLDIDHMVAELAALKRHFSQISKIEFVYGSGFLVDFDVQHVLDFHVWPDIVKRDGQFVIVPPGGEGQ